MVIMRHILIVLQLNTFQKKIKTSKARNILLQVLNKIQEYESMLGCVCIGLTDFMFKGESVLNYINFSPPDEFGKKDKIILKYF